MKTSKNISVPKRLRLLLSILQDAINTYYAVRMDSKNGGSMANDGKKFFHLKI